MAAGSSATRPGTGASDHFEGAIRPAGVLDSGAGPIGDLTSMTRQTDHTPRTREPTTLEWTCLSFAYWVVFMGALAPGNVSHILADGDTPNWGGVLVRLVGAGVLGASVTPLLLELRNRFPLSGAQVRRNLTLQLLAVIALAAILILASCLLVAWVLDRQLLPTADVVTRHLFANLALLILCISLLLAAIQAAPMLLRQAPSLARDWPNHLAIGDRGRTIVVPVSEIDWIEAQGNYQALHTKSGVHLYRATSAEIEGKLDSKLFVRIHRGCLVALKAIERLEPLSSGDGLVVLTGGAKLRQARRYRAALRERLHAG